MGKFNRLEDIVVWQRARSLSNRIVKISFLDGVAMEYDLKRQIRRSGASIAANIAEGYGRRSKKEFAHFLDIAYGSAVETKSHLFRAHDEGYVSEEDFKEIFGMIDEINRMLFVLANKVRGG